MKGTITQGTRSQQSVFLRHSQSDQCPQQGTDCEGPKTRRAVECRAKSPQATPTTTQGIISSLKKYKSNRDVETAILRLGCKGRTDEALQLYYAVCLLDGLKQQCRRMKQQRSAEKAVAAKESATVVIDNNVEVQLDDDLVTYITESKLRPTTRLMNSAINACAQSEPFACQSTAFDIFSSATHTLGLTPNVFTFGSLLLCCARNGDISTSLEILHNLEEGEKYPDVAPNEVIYSTVISSCERSPLPNVDLALEVLNRSLSFLAAGKTSSTMGVVGYNAAMSTIARAEQWKMAVQLLGEMMGDDTIRPPLLHVDAVIPKPDETTFRTVVAACERACQWEELLQVAKAANEYGVRLNETSLTSALHSCQQLGLADEAIRYLELMKRLGDE